MAFHQPIRAKKEKQGEGERRQTDEKKTRGLFLWPFSCRIKGTPNVKSIHVLHNFFAGFSLVVTLPLLQRQALYSLM